MAPLRILMISYTSFLQKFYQSLPYELARISGSQIKVLVPPYWRELWSRGRKYLEISDKINFKILTGSILFPGNLHFAFFTGGLKDLLRSFKPDIIDMDNEPFNAGSFQIARYRKAYVPQSKLVLHASQHQFKQYPPPFNYFESYNLSQADAILVRNQKAYEVIKRKGYGGVLEKITHGVDMSAFKPGPCHKKLAAGSKNPPPVIGYVGSLVEHKGLDLLMNAVAGILCKVILIGDGDQKVYLQKLAANQDIDVTFLSSLNHTEIAAYMNCFDIFVLPSRTRKNWIEKFGRVLIEAMSSGCAVIGSSCGEIPEVIGDAGLIFTENNAADLRKKITFLIENPDKRTELGSKARERVAKNYSWEKIADSTFQIYTRILQKSASAKSG